MPDDTDKATANEQHPVESDHAAPSEPRTLDPRLLEILACPDDKGPLYYLPAEDALYNPRLHRRYDVVDGIPVMLVEEATTVDDAEHERLMGIVERDGIAPTFQP